MVEVEEYLEQKFLHFEQEEKKDKKRYNIMYFALICCKYIKKLGSRRKNLLR